MSWDGAPRKRLVGLEAIHRALDAQAPIHLILLPRAGTAEQTALRQRAEATGIALWLGGDGDMRRMSPDSRHPATAIALLGQPPAASLDAVLQLGGVVWLLHRPAYPSNVGFMIRTAEVAGASAVVIDAPDFNREQRSRTSHVTMGADRVMPVLWTGTQEVLQGAKQHGLRTIAIEDSGAHPPHEVDLASSVVLLLGNERDGLPAEVRNACDTGIRIPMLGFVPSYSVQAAMAMVAGERLRQLQLRGRL